MTMTLVAAVARNGVIGRDGVMPWHLPEDLKHFKSVTMGKPMVMGRKTFESIGRPLPGRRSIVVTRDPSWQHPGVEVAHDLAGALELAGPEVMVVGGGNLYQQLIEQADVLEITRIDREVDGDTYFPTIDPDHWQLVELSSHGELSFCRYVRTETYQGPSR